MKKAILYVNGGEMLENADIECIFEYPETMDHQLEKTICQYIRDNLDSFDEVLSATFPCVYDVFLNDDDTRFPILQNKVLDAGLYAILEPKKASKKAISSSIASNQVNEDKEVKEDKEVNEDNRDNEDNEDYTDQTDDENETDEESDYDRDKPAIEEYWFRKCWDTKGKEYLSLLKKCMRDKDVDLSEISNFLFTTHMCNGTGSYYMYCASIHKLDNPKVYTLNSLDR
jgi:hypothetical protein